MAGTGFKMNLSSLQKMVGGAAKMQQTQALCEELGEMLASSTRERFKDEKGPDGVSWKKSGRVQNGGGQTLTDEGILKNSIGYEASMRTVAVGSNDIRAAIHNFGGEITPKKGKHLVFSIGGNPVFAKKVTMPARPFIGINEEDQDEAREIIKDFMQRGLSLK